MRDDFLFSHFKLNCIAISQDSNALSHIKRQAEMALNKIFFTKKKRMKKRNVKRSEKKNYRD